MPVSFTNTSARLVITANQKIPPGESRPIADEFLDKVRDSILTKGPNPILVEGKATMPAPVVLPRLAGLPADLATAVAAVRLESDVQTLRVYLHQEQTEGQRNEVLEALQARIGALSPPAPPPPAASLHLDPWDLPGVQKTTDGAHYLDTATNSWKPIPK